MAAYIRVNNGTKPLPEPMLTYHYVHLMAISQGVPQPSITKIRLKITYLIFLLNLPGAIELNNWSTSHLCHKNWAGPVEIEPGQVIK